jgi:hypothetical protein
VAWREYSPADVTRQLRRAPAASGDLRGDAQPELTLQLLLEPRAIKVTTELRRGEAVPVRYREKKSATPVELVTVAGPDRVSASEPNAPSPREYFHGVTNYGVLVLLYHDVRADLWYLHGWWD